MRLLAFVLLYLSATEGDLPGSKDPPAIGQRFTGARIVYHDQKPFESHVLATGKATGRGKLAKSLDLEGRVIDVRYEIPAERSILEVYRNYEEALKAKGFEILFACEGDACGGRDFNHIASAGFRGFQETPKGQRYLAASKGDVYASVFVVKNYGVGGPTKDKVYVRVVTVEAKPMETKLVTVGAAEMEQAIHVTGHVALYGIQFEFDSAALLPASKAAIAEVGKLLKKNSKLGLHVVGHTDSQGKLDYNLDLSRRRAQSVVQELVNAHGIPAQRLSAHGVGSLAPVASNDSEAGRAKNRRVELVAR